MNDIFDIVDVTISHIAIYLLQAIGGIVGYIMLYDFEEGLGVMFLRDLWFLWQSKCGGCEGVREVNFFAEKRWCSNSGGLKENYANGSFTGLLIFT